MKISQKHLQDVSSSYGKTEVQKGITFVNTKTRSWSIVSAQ